MTSKNDSKCYTKNYTTMGMKDLERVLIGVLYIYDRFSLLYFEWQVSYTTFGKNKRMTIFQRYLHINKGHSLILLVDNRKNDDDHKIVTKDI